MKPTTVAAASDSKSLLKKEDRQLFVELGILASTNSLPWEGHALFGQLFLVDPEEAYPRIGLAYCKIMGGQFDEAHKLLKNPVVERSSMKDYAIALRGLAFYLAKQTEELTKLFKKNETLLTDNLPALGMFKTLLQTIS